MRQFLLIILFQGVLLFLSAQNTIRDSIEYYLDDKREYPNLELRIADLNRGIFLSEQSKDTAKLVMGYFLKAAFQEDYSEFSYALKNIGTGRKLAESANDSLLIADSYYREAIIQFRMEKFELSEKLSKKSIRLFSEIRDTILGREKNLFHLAYNYSSKGRLDEAEKIYEEIIPKFEQNNNAQILKNVKSNLAVLYLRKNQPDKALPFFLQNLEADKKENDKIGLARTYGNLAYTYSLMKDYSRAFQDYEKSIEIAEKEGFDEVLYISLFDMSETYEGIGDYKGALEAFKKYHSIRDSVIGFQNTQKITELEVQYATERKELELRESQNQVEKLQASQEINRQQKWLLLTALISLLIIGGLFYQKLQGDVKKNRALREANEKLIQIELKNKELESLRLKEQIEYKNSDLTNLAIDITRRNEFSQELIERLESIEKLPTAELKSKIRELRLHTSGQFQVSEDLQTLQKNINEIGREFYKNLDEKISGLSANDKQLCGMIRLNLSNKEVATIKNISVKSAKMSRYRLRKKLGLSSEVDIVDFLRGF